MGRQGLYSSWRLTGDGPDAVAVILLPQGREDMKMKTTQEKQNQERESRKSEHCDSI